MKTADFLNMFKHHTLGKKRNFGSYRVIDGYNCQVLVRASMRSCVPNGSKLIAITFADMVTLWHNNNIARIKHTVVNDIEGDTIWINATILDENADNLLDSGIIDIDEVNNKMLIEIGDTPWLFEHEGTMREDRWSWKYNVGTKLDVRCSSVVDALVAAKMQPNTISTLGWTMEKMPVDFKPDGISAEDRITLSKPVNPMDYGFEIEQCQRETTYIRESVGPDLLFLKQGFAGGAKGQAYQAACKTWDDALSRFQNMRLSRYDNISRNGGDMVQIGGDNGVVYLRGEHRQIDDNSQTINLTEWHKLLSKSSKLRLLA